jgi:hypothetical protein
MITKGATFRGCKNNLIFDVTEIQGKVRNAENNDNRGGFGSRT